jgi:hypothetical protein
MGTSGLQFETGFNHLKNFGQVGLLVKGGLGHVALMAAKRTEA